jgi:hypothetical protein
VASVAPVVVTSDGVVTVGFTDNGFKARFGTQPAGKA